MRVIRTLPDVQRALNELFDWQAKLQSKDHDMRGLRIKNASPGIDPNDYATVSQLPKLSDEKKFTGQDFAIVFSSTGSVTVGVDFCAPYSVGRGREGIPVEAHIAATVAPSTSALKGNILINGVEIFDESVNPYPLTLSTGDFGPVISSAFIPGVPHVGYGFKVEPKIVAADDVVSLVSIILVVRRKL